MQNFPNFLIIGPPKCASTSLHYYLGQHPEVFVSPVKETNFFTHDYYKGLSFYSKYFADAGIAKAIGEATPSYFFLPFVAERLNKELPDAKLIVTLRNPVDRAFSHWLMFKEAGIEKKSFREAIELNISQMEHFNFEGAKGAELWDKRRNMTSDDEQWLRIYIQPGLYAECLNMYYQKFNPGKIHIVFLEDLKNRFSETMMHLFNFIGVNEDFEVADAETKNFYFDKKYLRILQKVAGVKTAKYISGKIPGNFKNIFKQKQTAVKHIPKISEADRAFLENYFTPDIKNLEKIIGRNLVSWLTYKPVVRIN